ncbi:MAG: membrane protein insertase YidC [Candidatus Omnitrophota bacterium]
MEKRLIAAIALSIVVIVSFQLFFSPRKSLQPSMPKGISETMHTTENEEYLKTTERVEQKRVEKVAQEKETIVETEKYIMVFTDIGGSLKSVTLKNYKNSSTDLLLVLAENTEKDHAILSITSNALMPGLATQKFALTEKENNRLKYTLTQHGKFEISKEYTFHNTANYIELRVEIQNLNTGVLYKDYDLIGASGLTTTTMAMGKRFVEIVSMVDGKILKNKKVKDGENFVRGIISWTGVKEQYFSIILKPHQESEGVVLEQFGKNALASGIRTKREPIYDGATLTDTYTLYMGPNDANILKSLGFGLEQTISYGFFGGISKFLLSILRIFHGIVKNWGVAIILLTCLINLTLFPLTRKSFMSMSKIQEVQPHIEKLRTLHKDNPQKLNKEMAELYREYNINPFGGCLPLLLQMPIFIALYQGLVCSIELKGAHFLWIKDLSTPDFINLPISLPFIGSQIHLLPLLMVGAMFMQQKISTKASSSVSAEQKQQQKIMLVVFPIFFGFLFYNFPSGLVLYWLTNTILMVIEHSFMRKSINH